MYVSTKFYETERAKREKRSIKQAEAGHERVARSFISFLKERPRYFPVFGVIFALLVIGSLLSKPEIAPIPLSHADPVVRAGENMAVLSTALELFKADCGRYPTDGEGLPSLLHEIPAHGWKGPYIVSLTRDPWRNRFYYERKGDTYLLCSVGRDGVFGTKDDIAAPPPDTNTVHSILQDKAMDLEPLTVNVIDSTNASFHSRGDNL
jgi:general secretion pathway protein G